MHLAKRIISVAPSATLAVSNLAKQMKAKGEDVIDLSIGQPDFTTPAFIADAAKAAINSGAASFYTAATGIPALKAAIAGHVERQTGVHYTTKQIAVTTGAKLALYGLFQVLLDPGEEVLIPLPGWVSYVEQVRLAGGVPRPVPSHAHFKVTVDDLEAQRTAKTRALVINSPANPTGTIYTKQELTLIGNWALQHDILVVADDIYRDLLFNGAAYTSMIEIDPEITKNTVLISGVSKSYAMTGWRIGFAAGPEKLISAMATLLGHATGNPTTAAQYAAIAAFDSDGRSVEQMRLAFEDRLNTLYPLVTKVPGFDLPDKPQGAFYLFPNVKRAAQLTNYNSVDDFVSALLAETGVAIVPGRAFGMPDHARLSYATAKPDLIEAVARINAFVGAN
ncbi:pyridoxal phosphate-dependent aminotransferase [Lacticaseibacillus daqingensis]|uniref:pyridoxal phosphate-dependent aminotransferase n=1 Tax=Lacticaseibacillus daqingensis TaxID=2486014 RepID=UPI000F7671E5|nr:pyridoxal phosphate-dependent aminotransferase [Lacticaseibacillus daqingensis]